MIDKTEDTIRVLRLIEYEGPRSLVERQVACSIHGTRMGMEGAPLTGIGWPRHSVRITATTLGEFAEVIEEARRVPAPDQMQSLLDKLLDTQQQLIAANIKLLAIGSDEPSSDLRNHRGEYE